MVKRAKSKKTSQPLLRNYGLFWKIENVFWGSPGKAGALWGVNVNSRKSKHIDFREQRGIYALYADYDIIYVGQNYGQGLLDRLKQHNRGDLANRWNRFSWFGMRKINKDGNLGVITDAAHTKMGNVLNHIEGILIHTVEPALNRQGGQFGTRTHQYLQVRDKRLGLSEADMLKNLYDKVNL